MQQFFLAQNDVYGHENGYRKSGMKCVKMGIYFPLSILKMLYMVLFLYIEILTHAMV